MASSGVVQGLHDGKLLSPKTKRFMKRSVPSFLFACLRCREVALLLCWEAIPFRRNEQHEPHAGSFQERHRRLLPRCEAVPSAPPHDAPRSASGKQEDRLLAALALAAAA